MSEGSTSRQDLSSTGKPIRKKTRLFLTVNALMFLIVILGVSTNRYADVYSGVYVLLLFLVCTTPFLFITGYRGKASLLIIFLAYYFATFALQDFSALFSVVRSPLRMSGFFSGAEIAVIVGIFCFILGYVLVLTFKKKRKFGSLHREWSSKTTALLAIISWAIGFYVTAVWQFGVGDSYSGAKINPLIGGFISLLRFLQPVGTLLLIYMYITTRNKTILFVLLVTMVADFGLGFFGDSKELALRAPILYIVSVMLLREKLPVVGIVLFAVFAGIAFNFFAAYRMDIHSRHESRADAFRDFGSKIDKISGRETAISERLQSGADYFVNRVSLKQNVELLVSKVGTEVDYLHGKTLEPLLYVFIPRFVMPNKPDSSQAGRLFNQAFGISGERSTFISMSQLGELYWNYGWAGLVSGMFLIGAFMGWLAILFRLDESPTAIKYLLLLITIYFLALRFEGALAMTYIIWARLAVLLLLIHFFMPKKKVNRTGSSPAKPAGISPF